MADDDGTLIVQAVTVKVNDYLKLGTPLTVEEAIKLVCLCSLDEADREKEDILTDLYEHLRARRALSPEIQNRVRVFLSRAWPRRLRDPSVGSWDLEALRAWLYPSASRTPWVMYGNGAYLFRALMFEGCSGVFTGRRGRGKTDSGWLAVEIVIGVKLEHIALKKQGREKASTLWQIYHQANFGSGSGGGAGESKGEDRIRTGLLECENIQVLTNSFSTLPGTHPYHPFIKVEGKMSDFLLDALKGQLAPGGTFNLALLDEAGLIYPNERQGGPKGWESKQFNQLFRKIGMATGWITIRTSDMPRQVIEEAELVVDKRFKTIAVFTTGDIRRQEIEPVPGTTLGFRSLAGAGMLMDVEIERINDAVNEMEADAHRRGGPMTDRQRIEAMIRIITDAAAEFARTKGAFAGDRESPVLRRRILRMLTEPDPVTGQPLKVSELYRFPPFAQLFSPKTFEELCDDVMRTEGRGKSPPKSNAPERPAEPKEPRDEGDVAS